MDAIIPTLQSKLHNLLTLTDFIDFSSPALYIAAASIAFNPIFWNIAARSEYHNKTITRLARGNAYYGCYLLAAAIFSLGIFRDYLYHNALEAQPTHPSFQSSKYIKPYAAILFATGNTLVLSSMWALGLTGTYLGDYFGILMDDIVTGFPFNVSSCPMYLGSSLSFLATALWYGKPAGLLLTAEVWILYVLALRFEE